MNIGDIFDFIGLLLDVFVHWRFFLCLIVAGGLAVLAYRQIDAEPLRLVICGLIVLTGVIAGVIWERRSG